MGYEPDGSGGCKPCDKDWFREQLSAPNCTACSMLDEAFVTQATGSANSSLCGKLRILGDFNQSKNILNQVGCVWFNLIVWI